MAPGLHPFALVTPSTRGLSLALTRRLLRSTNLPVFATHRAGAPEAVKQHILEPLPEVDSQRLQLLQLDLRSEDSISAAAQALSDALPRDSTAYIDTAFFTGGVLHPERQPADFNAAQIRETFEINVVSHLLLMKHFARFLPSASALKTAAQQPTLSKWVHVSARVGSITDNNLGGWYSYRASKAALNQAVRTFDLWLQAKKTPAICVGVHPGTVKTDLSRDFWGSVKDEKLFEPAFAAERLLDVVGKLGGSDRGKIWDWRGEQIPP